MMALGGFTEAAIAAQHRPKAEQARTAHAIVACGWCQHPASSVPCKCPVPCNVSYCLGGETTLEAMPGALHERYPVPRFTC